MVLPFLSGMTVVTANPFDYRVLRFPVEALAGCRDWSRENLARQLTPLLGLGIIAGGAARQFILGADAPHANDIDIFVGPVENPATSFNAVGRAHVKLRDLGYMVTKDNRMGTTTWETGEVGDIPVQVITRDVNKALRPGEDWSTAQNLIETFGLRCEQFALSVDPMTESVLATYSLDGEADTLDKVIHVNRIVDPIRLVFRIAKYGRKGFTIPPSEVTPLFEAYGKGSTEDHERWVQLNNQDRYQFDTAPR